MIMREGPSLTSSFPYLNLQEAKTVSELRNSKVQMLLELVKKAIFSSDRKQQGYDYGAY